MSPDNGPEWMAVVRRLTQEREALRAALEEVQEELAERSDVVDGADGTPSPNWAMSLLMRVQDALGES